MRISTVAASLVLLAAGSSSVWGDGIESIRWLLGDWSQVTEQSTTSESWTDIGNGVFKGEGTVTSNVDGQVGSRESLLLVEMGGEVFYMAKVKHNDFPVPFKLTASSANHVIFENSSHDFPKRLEYRLEENAELIVTVSDGAKRSFVIRFSKRLKGKSDN
jgi:hypothetical protein